MFLHLEDLLATEWHLDTLYYILCVAYILYLL